ncbi:MAG: site-specific DNA-methyltransferase [Parcubacteria group bacterium]
MPTLHFKGKSFVQNHHLAVPYHELVPNKSKSLTKKVSLHDNLIIHGDNLRALKALLPTYASKIKCIYIDPPYNTGNEHWAYNDNVNSPMMQEWLGKVVDREDLTRHDKWLCMMMPRLKLLRELLREDGSIFVQIDGTESAHLKMLMDEIFSEVNYRNRISWLRSSSGKTVSRNLPEDTDDIYWYSKTNSYTYSPVYKALSDKTRATYDKNDNDGRGTYASVSVQKTGSPGPQTTYDYVDNSGKVWKCPIKGYRMNQKKMKQLENDNRLILTGKVIREKSYWKERANEGQIANDFWYDIPNLQGSQPEKIDFTGQKPTALLKRILNMVVQKDDIVLDSFAGTGTTAQATLALNKEDGGNRKFILVEMEDYADKITAERVRRVSKGVPKAKDEAFKKGLGGTFSYFELGEPIELESILSGDRLPAYEELARYVFYTATGEEFDEKAVDAKRGFIGTSKDYDVYLLYKPDLDYLKKTALTLEFARGLGKARGGRRRLVFAPTKYLSQEHLDEFRIDFAQLPFEIYRLAR